MKGTAKGSPISSIVAEIYLQFYEDKNIKHLLETKNITLYTPYVDDILIIYDTIEIWCRTHLSLSLSHVHTQKKKRTKNFSRSTTHRERTYDQS
jgi:retron-type reverse transcriptase